MPRITISEPGKTPQPYRLKTDRELTKIGRGSDNDIILKSGSASTHHCVMKRVEGGFILEDNNSTNGIIKDDTMYKIIDLEDDDTINIGDDIEYHFKLSEEEIEILEEEDFTPRQQVAFPKAKKKVEPVALDLEDDEEEEDEDEYEEVIVRRKVKKKKKAVAQDLRDEDEDEENEEDEEEEIVKPKKKPKSKNKSSSAKEDSAKSFSTKKDSDKPRERAKPTAKPTVKPNIPGGVTTIIFAILAVGFLVGGMVIRHYQDHGTFLFSKQAEK